MGKIMKMLELPGETVFRETQVIITGKRQALIENYRNIIEYTTNLIRVQTKTGKIHILGRNLVIAYFRDDAMCVMGEVLSIEYH